MTARVLIECTHREHGRRSWLEECSRVIRSLGLGGSAPESDGCPDRTPRSPAPSDTPTPGHGGCWRGSRTGLDNADSGLPIGSRPLPGAKSGRADRDPFQKLGGRGYWTLSLRTKGGCEEPAARFFSDAQIASAYGLRDSRVGKDKGKKPTEGAGSITKVDTLPKTRFKTVRLDQQRQVTVSQEGVHRK